MVRMRYLAVALAVCAGIGAGAAWAASGGTSTSPSKQTPRMQAPHSTTHSKPRTHHCPNMGPGSSSSGVSATDL
jgi:hypothetical protein